jgi:hypothetical protein
LRQRNRSLLRRSPTPRPPRAAAFFRGLASSHSLRRLFILSFPAHRDDGSRCQRADGADLGCRVLFLARRLPSSAANIACRSARLSRRTCCRRHLPGCGMNLRSASLNWCSLVVASPYAVFARRGGSRTLADASIRPLGEGALAECLLGIRIMGPPGVLKSLGSALLTDLDRLL